MPIANPEDRRAYDRERKRRIRAEEKSHRDAETLDDIRTLLKVIVDQNNIILNHIINGQGKTGNVLPNEQGRTEVGQNNVLPVSDFSAQNPPESKLNGHGADMGRTKVGHKLDTKMSDFGSDNEMSYPSLAHANKEVFISSTRESKDNNDVVVDEDKRRVLDRARGTISDLTSGSAANVDPAARIQGKCPWEDVVGAAYIGQVAKKLVAYDVDMGSTGWVRKMFRHGYEQTGRPELTNEQIVLAVQKLFRALESNKEKVKSPSGWARSTFVGVVQEVIDG